MSISEVKSLDYKSSLTRANRRGASYASDNCVFVDILQLLTVQEQIGGDLCIFQLDGAPCHEA